MAEVDKNEKKVRDLPLTCTQCESKVEKTSLKCNLRDAEWPTECF